MSGPRNWDKELAEIDKLMGKTASSSDHQPAPDRAPGAVSVRSEAAAGAGAGAVAAAPGGHALLVMWLKTGLGVLGAGALLAWPYDRGCGVLLFSYLAGVLAVAGAGIWALLDTWRHRRSTAHTVALLVLLTAVVLAEREILPRVGNGDNPPSWFCSTP